MASKQDGARGSRLVSIDLFAGAGGMTEGFRRAGFAPLIANDIDEHASATFKANFPEATFLGGPIGELPGAAFVERLRSLGCDADAILGGPPCQAFSVYNHQRGFHDGRARLFREYLRIVEAVRPKVVVMENVTGMTSLGDGRAIQEIRRRLASMGYCVDYRILKAEEYGVPQERRRIFFIASRVGPVRWPTPTHGRVRGFVTVEQAIGDLPQLAMGEGSDGPVGYRRVAQGEYQEIVRVGSSAVLNHLAPRLAPINARRMKHIPQGGSWRDIPPSLLPAGMRRAKRSDHTKRYGRLHPKGLFSTIMTKADPHWGAYFHPHQDRSLTVRECARAQSFPDRFVFTGPRVEQYRQVGNAVPPLLAEAVAMAVKEMIGACGNRKGALIAS